MIEAEGRPPSQLRQRLGVITDAVAALVARMQADDPQVDDPYRGLHISSSRAAEILADDPWSEPPPSAFAPSDSTAGAGVQSDGERRGAPTIPELAARFGLDATDVDILLLAAGPEIDPRLERLYAYLNDDVTRRRLSVGLALRLLGCQTDDMDMRVRLGPHGPLATSDLVTIEQDTDRAVLSRSISVPDRIVSHLLQDDLIDPRIQPLLRPATRIEIPEVDEIAKILAEVTMLIHLVGSPSSTARSLGASALATVAGAAPLIIDLTAVRDLAHAEELMRTLVLEARLQGVGIVAGPIDGLVRHNPAAMGALADAPVPRVLFGTSGWDPSWGRTTALSLRAPLLSVGQRTGLWRDAVDQWATTGVAADPEAATAAFRLGPEQIYEAARSAAVIAAAESRPLTDEDLRQGARSQNAGGLETLALRIEPAAGRTDLVLSAAVDAGLDDLITRGRMRDRVLDEWGLASGRSRGRGITGLFAGPSGTGKTMAAEVVAGELGLDLYVIDLSTIVDKYIGETEKNLDKVFEQADQINGVLLFDEADALFGKRSDVSDAHDRHANVEVAYLLQRMEQFDGIALMTTNLRANIDDAFTRRIDTIVEFPEPGDAERLRLWQANLVGRGLPLDDDVDIDFLATRFKLSGGEISNIAVSAAYVAASGSGHLSMMDLLRATQREYRKLGRLMVDSEFGPYLDRLSRERD